MNERDRIVLEVLEKGYFATIKENWQKVRGKGAKSKLRFTVGAVLFTLGFIFLRSAVAVQETMLDILNWLHNREKGKEKA